MPKKINIKGVIVPNDDKWIYDLFGIESTSPDMVNEWIEEAAGDDLDVVVNSGGGDVFSGVEIYTALKEYTANVDVKIILAASAASVIAMAGDNVRISPPGQVMIHNASMITWGDKGEHRESARFLQKIDESIANAYLLKTGMSQAELLDLMNKETWMGAKEAKERGFADEIMFDEEGKISAVASADSGIIPQKVINKIRSEYSKFNPKGEKSNMGNENNQQQPAVTNQQQQPQAASTPPDNNNPAPATPPANGNGGDDPVAKERERVKAILDISNQIDQDLVNEAIENGMSAEELSFKAMKEGKFSNAGTFHQSVQANKAAGTEGVQPQGQEQSQEEEYDLSNIKDVNTVFAQIAANSQNHRPQNIRRR